MSEAPPERFKSRAAALEWLNGEGYGISRSKFYTDCGSMNMVQSDKSVRLVDLFAYVRRELKFDPLTGRGTDQPSPSDIEKQRERDELEHRKLVAEVESKERANRKEDAQWIKREKAYEREGALVTQIMGEARFQLRKAVPALITTCTGDGRMRIEVEKMLEGALFETFRTIYEGGEIEVAFEDEEEIE